MNDVPGWLFLLVLVINVLTLILNEITKWFQRKTINLQADVIRLQEIRINVLLGVEPSLDDVAWLRQRMDQHGGVDWWKA